MNVQLHHTESQRMKSRIKERKYRKGNILVEEIVEEQHEDRITELEKKIQNMSGGGPSIDVSGFLTKDDLTKILSDYATKTHISDFESKLNSVTNQLQQLNDLPSRLSEVEKKIKLMSASTGPDLDQLMNNLITKDEFANFQKRIEKLEGETKDLFENVSDL